MRICMSLMIVAGLMIAPGCGDDADSGADADTGQSMTDQARDMAERAGDELKQQTQAIGTQLEALRQQAMNNPEVQDAVETMEAKYQLAKEKLAEAADATGDAANQARAEAQELLDEINQLYKQAKADLQNAVDDANMPEY